MQFHHVVLYCVILRNDDNKLMF